MGLWVGVEMVENGSGVVEKMRVGGRVAGDRDV